MSNIYLFKLPNGTYKPETDKDKELMRGVKTGSSIRVKFSQPRNVEHHRLYWAVVQMVWENLPEEFEGRYPTVEVFNDELKILAGHFEKYTSITGEVYFKPKSIDFASMGQQKFNEYFEKVMVEIEKYFLDPKLILQEAKRQLAKKVFH